jgi:hypothetical protein
VLQVNHDQNLQGLNHLLSIGPMHQQEHRLVSGRQRKLVKGKVVMEIFVCEVLRDVGEGVRVEEETAISIGSTGSV